MATDLLGRDLEMEIRRLARSEALRELEKYEEKIKLRHSLFHFSFKDAEERVIAQEAISNRKYNKEETEYYQQPLPHMTGCVWSDLDTNCLENDVLFFITRIAKKYRRTVGGIVARIDKRGMLYRAQDRANNLKPKEVI